MRFLHAGAVMGALAIALQAPVAVAAHPAPYAVANGTRAVLARIASTRRSQAAPVGHFDGPYGLATDQYGNLFVADTYGKDDVVEVYSSLVIRGNILGAATPAAISIAVDSQENIYVGSEYGYINKFGSSGGLDQHITANASFPSSFAVDEYQNLYIVSGGGVAVDDPVGGSIFSSLLPNSSVDSLALGGPNLFAFADDKLYFGDGSYVLRRGSFTYQTGIPGSAPVGAACANNGTCWFVDSNDDQLIMVPFPPFESTKAIKLNYLPGGVAYDAVHNRLFVADPDGNAVQIYTASTLQFEKTLR